MYILENNRICIFRYLDSDFVGWPLEADTLNNDNLFFFIFLYQVDPCVQRLLFS